MAQAQSAIVHAVNDPLGRGRVQIRLNALDPDGDALVWARVATGFAGDNYGLFAIPAVDEEVMVVFLNGDPAYPVVVGALWNGATSLPEDAPGDDVKLWSINGRNGSRIAIDENTDGSETLSIATPGGVRITCTDGGTKIELVAGSQKVTLHPGGIDLETPSLVKVKAGTALIDATGLTCTASQATFTGEILCQKLTTTSVISANYSPGNGNVW